MPQVVDLMGPVLRNPRLQPIVFAGDPIQTDIAAFTAALGQTGYWFAVGEEYGVGAATGLPVAVAEEPPPTAIDDAQVRDWLASKITDRLVPAPDGETIYAIYYPAGTTITSGAGTSCVSFSGYHGEGTSAQNERYVYAVLARCHNAWQSDLANLTNASSHEFIEASTNPYFSTAPAYATIDAAHYVWAVATGGSTEVGDMCTTMPGSEDYQPPDLPYAVQRIWSNAAAAASHDPCVPAAPGTYFNAAPVLPDTITIDFGAKGKVTTEGVRIPVGQPRTIDVALYSDEPTSGPWAVEAFDVAALAGKPAALDMKLDRTAGSNGDVLHLTITPLATNPYGIEAFYIGNRLSARTTLWVGLVSNE
jgi:hypothetical protein